MNVSPARAPRFTEIALGYRLAEVRFGPLSISDTVRWAGSQELWEPLHFDREYAREQSGQNSFIASGQYRQAMLARMLTDWIGPQGILRRLRVRHLAPTLEGELMCFLGVVTEKSSDAQDAWVGLDIEGKNERSEAIMTAQAVVVLP